MHSIKKFFSKKKSHLKKILASKKKILVVMLSLFVLFGGLSSFFLQGRDDASSSVPSSSELGIGAFSPLGESGGSVVPASCPSDLHDAPWYGQACTSAANACGQTSSGTRNCDGSCSAGPSCCQIPKPGPYSCLTYAGSYGIPAGYTSGYWTATMNSCTGVYSYVSGCSLPSVYGACNNTGGYNCAVGGLSSPSGGVASGGWTWYCDGTPNDASHRSPQCHYCITGNTWNGSACVVVALPPASSVSVSPDPVPYGSNTNFTLSSTNAAYCYVRVNSATYIVNGYTTSGTFNYGPFTTQGLNWVQSYCYNSAWVGSGWSNTYFNVSPPAIPAALHICPPAVTVALNGTNNLRSWFTPIGTSFIDCSNLTGASDVTGSTSWTSSAPANVTVDNGTSKGLVTGKTASSSSLINAGYAGVAAAITVNVAACSPTITCASQSGGYCNGESFSVPDNGCGTSLACTNAGTRYCDYNWKEVAP